VESFEGKVALVTGGASGIGRAVVERLSREGALCVVADIDERLGDEVATANRGLFIRTDVSDPHQLQAAVDAAIEKHGRLDIVHLNAGVATGENDITAISLETYRRAVGINLDGVVFGTRYAVPAMNEGGAIVVTASLAGLMAYTMDFMYGATKHAVVGFVRAVAEQLAARNITINAICPGFTDTPILGPFAEEFRKQRFPLLCADEVAEAFVGAVRSGAAGEVFIVQPGLLGEPYRFRGIPGPRVAGEEGKAPPLLPGP
jgi:NAD(P)-dependent dehydrogenase (short-subunit alcohol dehydrogenase family)